MLTQYLMQLPAELKVVEADGDMVRYLQHQFPALDGRILSGDFLKLDLEAVFTGSPFILAGNFPYNISSQILFHMLTYRSLVPQMVGMFQKEVAERIVSPPGSKTYGVISVLIQAWYAGKVLFQVSKGSFDPPPKVESAVIRLDRKETNDLGCSENLFRQVVKQAFSQRRKMLRNTMKAFLSDPEILSDPFFTQRPERLSVEQFVYLTNLIEQDPG